MSGEPVCNILSENYTTNTTTILIIYLVYQARSRRYVPTRPAVKASIKLFSFIEALTGYLAHSSPAEPLGLPVGKTFAQLLAQKC